MLLKLKKYYIFKKWFLIVCKWKLKCIALMVLWKCVSSFYKENCKLHDTKVTNNLEYYTKKKQFSSVNIVLAYVLFKCLNIADKVQQYSKSK